MARLGVETAGRAFSSINTTMVAICCERYSLQSPWELVGRSAWSARIGIARAGPLEGYSGRKGVNPFPPKLLYTIVAATVHDGRLRALGPTCSHGLRRLSRSLYFANIALLMV